MFEKTQTPTNGNYESIVVPILRTYKYLVWKVKMAMFLEATYPEFLDKIYDGPHMPTSLSNIENCF